MTRIGLVVTGESERIGLAPALHRLFPDDEFVLVPGQSDGFTSRRIPEQFTPAPPPLDGATNEEKLARTLLGAVTERRSPFDFAILIDDLEVDNWGRSETVVDYFCQTVSHVLSRESAHARQQMLDRCSFHLLHPMLESLFFADPAALTTAGVSATTPVLRQPGDVELFEATDPEYLSAPDEPKANRKRNLRRWAVADRLHKPKHYLIYLSEQEGGTPYHETDGGVAALSILDWAQVFSTPTEVCFARSLIEDISSMLGTRNPYPGTCAPQTWRSSGGKTLRNV